MFSHLDLDHLKNEELMDIMEGESPSTELRAHLDSCKECECALMTTAVIYQELAALDADIPEPDWEELRTSVRRGLLSRLVQRQSMVRRWTGLPIRSSLAFALLCLIVVGLTTGGFLWNIYGPAAERMQSSQAVTDMELAPADFTSSSHDDAFEALSQVSDDQEPQLRQLIQSALSASDTTFERQ